MPRLPCRLIIDEPRDGPTNMAADEWLLQWAAEKEGMALRFYSWSRPTLSLGYFQRIGDREHHADSLGCEIVRRASGGGAILHHHELTYAFVMPITDRAHSSATSIYDLFHETLIATLADFSVPARLANARDVAASDPNSFLCFQRRSLGDVVWNESKIGGSAQRRHANAMVQHGSILLNRSDFAPELPGINDLGSANVSAPSLREGWLPRVADRRGLVFSANSPFSPSEHEQIREISNHRFASNDWIHRR